MYVESALGWKSVRLIGNIPRDINKDKDQGQRTWIQGPKSRTFDFPCIYHAAKTNKFRVRCG